MRSTLASLFRIALVFCSLVVDADVSLVNNGDFSIGALEKLGNSTWVYDTPEAWTATGASVIIHKDDVAWGGIQPVSGDHLVGLQHTGSYISQPISFPSAGDYKISLSACSRPGYGRAGLLVAVSSGIEGESLEIRIEGALGHGLIPHSSRFRKGAGNATLQVVNTGPIGDQTLVLDFVRISALDATGSPTRIRLAQDDAQDNYFSMEEQQSIVDDRNKVIREHVPLWIGNQLVSPFPAGGTSYRLQHRDLNDVMDQMKTGAWGEPLLVQERVLLESDNGAEYVVSLYLGDLLSATRLEEIVELNCEVMALQPYRTQCSRLQDRVRYLVARRGDFLDSEWRAPALCTLERSMTSAQHTGVSFLILGDSHTRMWRLAALRSSIPFTIVEACGATAYGVGSNRSKSGSRQLFSTLLDREKKSEAGKKHTFLVVQLGEVDVGSSAWWRAARQLEQIRSLEETNKQNETQIRPPVLRTDELMSLNITSQLEEAAARLFAWLLPASANAGFEPYRVIVFGPNLPTIRQPWDNDTGNSDATERVHVRSSKAARSDATRLFASMLRKGCEKFGFAYTDVIAATTDTSSGELHDFFHNPALNDLKLSRGAEKGSSVVGYDIHMDPFRSYTHFLEALAVAVGGVWCDPTKVAVESDTHGRGKTDLYALPEIYSNARGKFKGMFVRKDPEERSEL